MGAEVQGWLMISKLSGMLHWYKYTSTMIGMILLPYFLAIIASKSWAEVLCRTMDRGCEYSWTYDVGAELQATMARNGGSVGIKPKQ